MGIREHLSKEVDEKDMKLSDLSLSLKEGGEKKRISWEDIEEMITDVDREKMERTARIPHFTSSLLDFRILFPEKMDDLFPEEKIEACWLSLDQSSLDNLAGFKRAFPEARDVMKLDESVFNRVKNEMLEAIIDRTAISLFNRHLPISGRDFLNNSEQFLKKGYNVLGVDPSQYMADLAKEKVLKPLLIYLIQKLQSK